MSIKLKSFFGVYRKYKIQALLKMSVEMNQVIVTQEVVVEKEMRTLPGKYSKFAGFAYWLLTQMKDEQILSGDSYDATCKMMHLLSSDIAAQVAFYERYFAEASVSAKIMKADIKNRLKPAKVPKEKKEKKEKKPKKTEQINNTNNDIITQIVQRANSVDGSIGQLECHMPTEEAKEDVEKVEPAKEDVEKVEPAKEDVEKKKRVRKSKEVVVDPASTDVKLEVVENKKRVRKSKEVVVDPASSDVKVEVVENKKRSLADRRRNISTPILSEEEEDEVTLHAVLIDMVEYYYDSKNQLYNAEHSVIGTFDPQSLSASFV